jgi:hypothetical protein
MAYRAQALPQQRERGSVAWSWRAVRAAAAVVLFSIGIAWLAMRPGVSTWEVTNLRESSSSDAPIDAIDRLYPGRWLETDAMSSVRVTVADIGHVTVEPNSRLRLLASRSGDVLGQPEHRLELDFGSIHAVIDAPPRLFFVNTRAAVAIDYGCQYTLTMDQQGVGLLNVQQGLVMLEGFGRSVLVPMNASCPMRDGAGPGTPFGDHASPELRERLFEFDSGRRDRTIVISILEQCTNLDTVTLWHLLEQVSPADRRLVIDHLAKYVPLPADVGADQIASLERSHLDRWRIAIERFW